MNLSAAERETSLVISDDDKRWKLYTCQKTVIYNLEKQGFRPDKVDIDKYGNEYRTYILQRDEVKFRKKKIYTEEQKEKMRNRFIASMNKNK